MLFRSLAFAGPREGAVPFDYAFSTRAPMYGKVPVEKDRKKGEKRLRPVAELAKVPRSTAGHEDLADFLAADTNQIATLIICRETNETADSGLVHAFATKENGSRSAPVLRVKTR